MRKTISLQWHNRPTKSKQSLDALEQCEGIKHWDVYCFIDDPENDKVLARLKRLAFESALIDHVLISDHLGMKGAWDRTMEWVFENVGTDYNFHLEDDIVPAPDVLKYGLMCYEFLDEKTQTVACHTHPTKLPDNRDIVHRRIGFACWGWFGRPEFYFDHYLPAEDQGWDGKAIDIFRRFQNEEIYEIYPEKRRVKNIGIGGGVNPHDPDSDPLAQKPDEYTGGTLQINRNPKLCEECAVTQCETAENLNGVRN